MSPRGCRSLLLAASLTSATAFAPRTALAVVDGHLDPDYGAAIITQTNLTQLRDSTASNDNCGGWQLDAAYGFVAAGTLHLMFTGNMLAWPNNIDPGTITSPFHVFIDCQPGGQNPIQNDGYPSSNLAGLRFDTAFVPEFWLFSYASGGPDFGTPYRLEVTEVRLGETSATGNWIGGIPFGASGPLTGSSNPDQIEAAIDDSNRGGVTQGCGPASPGPVSTGIEFAIPLTALGNPSGPIKVCAFYQDGTVTNQILGTVPIGTCSLGAPNNVDLSAVSGDQFFTIPQTVTVSPVPFQGLFLAPRTNPDRGLNVIVEVRPGLPARAKVFDLAGRRVIDRSIAPITGRQTLTLAPPGTVPPGGYLVELRQGGRVVTARVTVIR